MDRDIALRIDGYMTALGAIFSSAADYIRNNAPDDQRHEYIRLIGKASALSSNYRIRSIPTTPILSQKSCDLRVDLQRITRHPEQTPPRRAG
jgi:hypothetical protein